MTSRFTRCLLAGLVWLLVSGPAPSAGAPPDVVAEVDGVAITNEEIDAALGAPLRRLERQIYDMKRQRIEAVIDERLLAREAAQRGMTVPALVDLEITAKVASVTDADVETYYAANRARLTGIKSQLKGQIRTLLENQRLGERRTAFLEPLRSRAQVTVYLKEPPVIRIAVSADGAPSIGAPDAPVTIVEFSDFQCPYCKRVLPTLTQLRARYGEKIRLVFRDFPLDSIHPAARSAAEAARCAHDQGKFWDYHDLLFAKAPNLGPEQLAEYAQTVGLDLPKFEQCLSSRAHAVAVQKDFDEGRRLGVTGTPGFFINGQFLSGAQPLESFVKLIEDELRRAK